MDEQGGFEVPGEETYGTEDADAAEEIPEKPVRRNLATEGEFGTDGPSGSAQEGKKSDMLPSKEPACNQGGEDKEWQWTEFAVGVDMDHATGSNRRQDE